LACVLRATTKKGRQLFWRKKCTPEKILATLMNLRVPMPWNCLVAGIPSDHLATTAEDILVRLSFDDHWQTTDQHWCRLCWWTL